MSDAPLPLAGTQQVSFYCNDCGSYVYRSWMFPDEPLVCFVCRFIRQAPSEDRGALRAQLFDSRQIEHWNAIGAYRNEACEERRCDHCNTPYRGPGVYCCRRCAITEAA